MMNEVSGASVRSTPLPWRVKEEIDVVEESVIAKEFFYLSRLEGFRQQCDRMTVSDE